MRRASAQPGFAAAAGAAVLCAVFHCGDSGTQDPDTTPALRVGLERLTIYAAPDDTTLRVCRVSLSSTGADTLRQVDGLTVAADCGSGHGDWLSAVVDTLSSGALVLAHEFSGLQLDTGIYDATVTVSAPEYQSAVYTVQAVVQPFVLRLVLPPIAGHEEEDVDAVTQASDVIPQLSFIVDPPRQQDSLDYVIVRTTDIDTTIYDTRLPGKQVLPYFYGRKIAVSHWYVKRPETQGVCTTSVYAYTHGGLSATDRIVVRVLDRYER